MRSRGMAATCTRRHLPSWDGPGYSGRVRSRNERLDVVKTERLVLSRPFRADLDGLFAIESDPRVWSHYPSLRHREPDQTLALIERWSRQWADIGFGPWVARLQDESRVIGSGGCSLTGGVVWNLGYRFAADVHGRGYATELAREAIRHARAINPELPVIASLLEHNIASERVALKLELERVYRAPDSGNPDPSAIRLVYADRPLTDTQLSMILR
jgi:RimJ/RimL family protein N-acetyltransferase